MHYVLLTVHCQRKEIEVLVLGDTTWLADAKVLIHPKTNIISYINLIRISKGQSIGVTAFFNVLKFWTFNLRSRILARPMQHMDHLFLEKLIASNLYIYISNRIFVTFMRLSAQIGGNSSHFVNVGSSEHYLRMKVSTLMLHCPYGKQEPAADPSDSGQLSKSHGAPLHRGEVVHHRDRQHSVEGLIAVWQAKVVAYHHLKGADIMFSRSPTI